MMKKIVIILAGIIFLGCYNPQIDIRRADRLALLSQKSYREAASLYNKALTSSLKEKQRDAIRLKLGKLYLRFGDFPAAIEQFKQLYTKDGQSLLALALFRNSDFTGALEVFNKAGEKGDAQYLYDYGLTLEKNNLYDQALRIYSLIKADPSFEQKAKIRIQAISLMTGGSAFSGVEEAVKKIIKESPSGEDYPDASGLYLLSDEKMYLTEDNRFVSDEHYVIKILNDRGKEKFAEVSLTYDSTYEKLELEYARTIKPDGSVVTVGDKNIRDVSLYLNYPLYSNARARIISMPEVAPGCVIEYKAKLYRSRLPNKKDFNTIYWLAADEPILLQRCTIDVPKSKKLRYKIVNGTYNTLGFDMDPKVRDEGNRRVYSLEFKNVPQIIPEPSMPPLSRIDPYILFSTFESWQDIYTWWLDLYKDKIIASQDIKAKVQELVKGKLTIEEKARAIYNFCASEIRYVAVEYGEAGYEPHKASEIFQNKYGDCKDKAILLISMLREAGIDAFPVLISTLDSLDPQEDLPSLLFNHAIAVIQLGENLIFMDATGNTVSFRDLPIGDQDRLTLVFFKDKYGLIKIPRFPSEHNKTSTAMKIKVKPDESIDAQRQVETWGAFQQGQRYWLKFTMPVLIEEGLKQRVRAIADSAVLEKYEINNVDDLDQQVSLKYSFSAPQYFIKAGPSRIMDQLGGMDTSIVVKDSRRYPIEFPALALQEESVEVELPANLAVKYLPPPVEIETKWFFFVSKYEIVNKNLIRYRYANRTKETVVPVEEYKEYKKAVENIATLVNQHVVLEEKK